VLLINHEKEEEVMEVVECGKQIDDESLQIKNRTG
jgi:hypothetical protein